MAVAALARMELLTAGELETCARTAERIPYCWGSNQFGQLGDGTTTDRATVTRVLGFCE